MTEPNKPLEQMTVQERLDLGISSLREGRFDEAIKAWSSIRREEAAPETYAGAQYSLGLAYAESGELEQAIKTWSNIRREEAAPKTYAGAQLGLGAAYQDQGKLKQAIDAWSNIRRSDDSEIYALAQHSLGVAYAKSGELKQAIKMLSNIRREEAAPETYAGAQLGLSTAYQDQGKLKQAIDAWSNIRREEAAPETYAQAQLNLGFTYAKSGKREQAIKTWSNIRREEAAPETYALAQFNLGVTYANSGKRKQAIEAWSNIRRSDDSEIYALAQFNIGKIYEDKGDLERAKEAYCNAQDFFYYNYERVKRILECPPKVIKKLRGIAENTDEVLKSLQIIPDFESQVAHYSRASTAFTLLEKKRKDQKPSHFRLSTIRGVNDPTEGLVLGKYWAQQGISETIHTNDTATFISCFTFNHDSLNQFRLYGKENGQEATGVSLVFKKEFFSDQSDTLEFIAAPSIDPPSKLGQDSSKETEKPESNKLIGKSTLYRCIYLDPETWYWTLAQRDRSTFYRENKKAAKDQWNEYSTKISGIKDSVKNCLFDDNNSVLSMLKSISEELEESNAPEESHTYSIEEKQKILEAVRFILLPLQYLVKHIAFQEEQECRIMYTTHLHDEKIRHDWEKQWMYVEYKEKVLPHIDKIWLSPGAAKYQDFFRILLDQGSGKSKVRISQNPFRNKE
ncbi:tetratricopeptide repeat protein [Rothia dentocariosa]|uniref:tetratricopeptide repeat protein n=1 Tax=Rothia dentocariosa TaxID=2047 RepID=UPI00352D93B5